MRSNAKGRQTKSKARIAAYDELVRKSSEQAPTGVQIVIPVAERLGQNVVDLVDLSKGYGDRVLIDKLTFKLPPGGIVGVIGANGAGKSTLVKLLMGIFALAILFRGGGRYSVDDYVGREF